MVSGIVLVIIGIIWFIYSFASGGGVNSAIQQTVQFLGFVCGSVFFVGGVICINLKNGITVTKDKKLVDNEEEEVVFAVVQNIDDKKIKLKYRTKLLMEPDKNSKFICNLLAGEVVTLLEKKELNNIVWYNVRDKKNNEGWFL